MNTKLYNQEGKIVGEIDLPDSIFGVKWNADLVHQAYRVMRARSRKVIAHTKGRGEVRGGGRKPWPQKGTGRARHGSIRSPLWRGGGVTHGPTKFRNFLLHLPKKMRRKAIATLLSKKAQENKIVVLDQISFEEGKTKYAAKFISNFNSSNKEKRSSLLLLLPQKDRIIHLAFRNIPRTKTIIASNLNVLDLLNYDRVFIHQAAIPILEKNLIKR